MRLRNKPWAKPLIEENPDFVVTEPTKLKGKWHTRFQNNNPIFVEIGMGKGRFIVEMAKKESRKELHWIRITDSCCRNCLEETVRRETT